jgi:lysozyme family protein
MTFLSSLARRFREVASVANVRKPVPPAGTPVLPPTVKAANEAINAAVDEALRDAPIVPAPLPPVTHPDRFPAALKIILKHEGGYVNHPKDPGGRTNLGVTQRVWEAWVKRPVTEQEMRALKPDMVAPLYRKNYWDKVRAPELPAGLDLHVFDFGVNAGPARAIRYLQMMIGAGPDGKFGPETRRKLAAYVQSHGTPAAIRRYGDLREQYYRQLRTFPTFGRGWLRRNNEVTADALKWAGA